MKRRKRKELLTEPSSEQMRTKYAGIERTDLWQIWWRCSDSVFLRKVEKWEEKGVVFIRKCTEEEATLRFEVKTNQKTTCVVRHNYFRKTCQTFCILDNLCFSNHRPLNLVTVHPVIFTRQLMDIELSSYNPLTVTLISPFSQITTDQKGWRLQLKRIKMKPDGPCKMGLTDPCPWAKERQTHFL